MSSLLNINQFPGVSLDTRWTSSLAAVVEVITDLPSQRESAWFAIPSRAVTVTSLE
jgi:hypothetical protein